MINNAEHSRRDDALGLLLDGREDAEGMDAARTLLSQDATLRNEYNALSTLGASFTELGEVFTSNAGSIDILDDVFDSIAHMAFEELGVAKASPYGDLERDLRALKQSFDAQVGEVSLVADIMAAVAASRKSDSEVERPFARVAMELNGLGTALNAQMPEVDIVEPVMERIDSATHAQPNLTPFRARPAVAEARMVSRHRHVWPGLLGWAAAAAVCAVSGWVYLGTRTGLQPGEYLAHHTPGTTTVSQGNGEPPLGEVIPFSEGEAASTPGITPGENTPASGNVSPSRAPLTLQDAINARRKDLLSQGNDFALLASLTDEEASALLKKMDLSLEAVLGAAQFLSTDEAIAVLRAAIAEHPDDPNLKYALALSLDGNPDATDERIQQLTQLAAADTGNSLPQYMLAADYFERGDMAQALDALGKGSAYTEASAYALESARQREAALVASGLDSDTARFLALSTTGNGEYENITTLRNELLDYGAHYEEIGEYETAQQIYNAVNQLGQQLYEGADMAVEQQYGLETQQDAILAIQGIAEIFQQPETVALLGETLGMLASGIVDVTQYISARQQMVTNSANSNQLDWTAFLNHVMNNGDLNVSGFVR